MSVWVQEAAGNAQLRARIHTWKLPSKTLVLICRPQLGIKRLAQELFALSRPMTGAETFGLNTKTF